MARQQLIPFIFAVSAGSHSLGCPRHPLIIASQKEKRVKGAVATAEDLTRDTESERATRESRNSPLQPQKKTENDISHKLAATVAPGLLGFSAQVACVPHVCRSVFGAQIIEIY